VGPPRYYTGPSWRIPDGPIVALNYKGTLYVYQGNGNGELVARGTSIQDWVISPQISLKTGISTAFDSCGAWLMRAFTSDTGEVIGFYHAETACNYINNGQTRKSCAYSVSTDGGSTFMKPNYPNNRLIDTNTPFLIGLPSGEGDFSVVQKGKYYYLFFSNVEHYYTGVARANVSSGAIPGAFQKYYNGQWSSSGMGGLSSGLRNISGTQTYLHTPSQSFVAVGNDNPYWNKGFLLSVSDNAINWTYFADPIATPDPVTNNDLLLYPSFIGNAGGYDIGNTFELFYLWVAPGKPWAFRYQILKSITISYVGKNNTSPSTKVALTTYRSVATGETWQSTEMAFAPYKATNIVGYLMTRPYSQSFVVYDCYNYTTSDNFVGTADECVLSGAGVTITRTLGYMWATRVINTSAVYRCQSITNDLFLSKDPQCEGRALAPTKPFGYVMDGPSLASYESEFDPVIPQGSNWLYYNKSIPLDRTWMQTSFDDRNWQTGDSPFNTGYSSDLKGTPFGMRDHYFRRNFTVPVASSIDKLLLSIASDNYAIVYINGYLVDSDPAPWHEAAYWNRRVYVNTSIITTGPNYIAAITKNMDRWAFFDLELSAKYKPSPPAPPIVCTPACVNGQCVGGECVCDKGWDGPDCGTNLCSFSGPTTQVIVPSGSRFRHTAWIYVPSTPVGWFATLYDDGWWRLASAPFATPNYTNRATTVAASRHLYRKKFLIDVPYGAQIESGSLSLATDDTHRIYINGNFMGAPIYPYVGHQAQYWNDVIPIVGGLLNEGINVISIEVPLVDQRSTTYFDMQLSVTFSVKDCLSPVL